MTIQHLDFSRLKGALLAEFKRTLQWSIATEAGGDIEPSGVLLELKAGSVHVAATVPGLNGSLADDLASGLDDSPDFGRKMANRISVLEGIDDAATGPISVTDVSAQSTAVGASGFDFMSFVKWGAVSLICAILIVLLLCFGKSCCSARDGKGAAGSLSLEGGEEDHAGEGSSFGPKKSPQQVSSPLSRPLAGSVEGSPASSSEAPSPPLAKAKARGKAKAKASVAARLPRNEMPTPRIAPVPHSAPQSRSSSRSSRPGAKAAASALLGTTVEEPSEGTPTGLGATPRPGPPGSSAAPAPEVASRELSISTMEISSPPGGGGDDGPGAGQGEPGGMAGALPREGGEEGEFMALAIEMGIEEGKARQAWRDHPGDSDAALAAALQ